jgi:hypothetical protein
MSLRRDERLRDMWKMSYDSNGMKIRSISHYVLVVRTSMVVKLFVVSMWPLRKQTCSHNPIAANSNLRPDTNNFGVSNDSHVHRAYFADSRPYGTTSQRQQYQRHQQDTDTATAFSKVNLIEL